MARTGKEFNVDTSPTKEIVVGGITRDATISACVFDLIDNSIDAARNVIFTGLPAKAREVPPDDYSPFKITVGLSGSGFKIEDNCGGIPVDQLQNMVMRFGARSQHKLGIGVFGVGLNRALFRLGKVSHFTTDTGKQRATFTLNTDDYLKKPDDWELRAVELQSTGKPGTTIEIRQLSADAARLFGSERWVKALQHEVGLRYGRFAAKKLNLSVEHHPIQDERIKIRENSLFESVPKLFKSKSGVVIEIEYGQHENHRFSFEDGFDLAQNRRLTVQYGWTVLCNDRAIIIADKSDKTGWETKFHTEFYGFVGTVNFRHPDPSKLPWNTTKTDVDMNNEAYREALDNMRHFAKAWRGFQLQRLKGKGRKEGYRPIPPKPAKPSGAATAKPTDPSRSQTKPTQRADHNQYRTVLPSDINPAKCLDKLLALVNDGRTFDIVASPYSGLALLRMLFECATVTFMERHGRYDAMKTWAMDRRRKKGVNLSAEEEPDRNVRMDEMLVYFSANPDIWGTAKRNHLKHIVKNMAGYTKVMNTVIHNPYQLTDRNEALKIRTEVIPLLRHMIET
jgi:hypothetical protein